MNKTRILLVIFLGLIMLGSIPMVFAGDVNLAFDFDIGSLSILNNGIDSSTWHTGSVGQSSLFSASGDVQGSYYSVEGNFGQLHTTINANTDVNGGMFTLSEYVDFNVVSANHIYNTEGFYTAGALGAYAEMNIDVHGSMYVWSEHDQSGSVLVGQDIYQTGTVKQSSVIEGAIGIQVTTDGSAQMWNDQAWGFGLWESGAVSADYSSGLNHISSTGAGTYMQSAFGIDYAELNGITLLGGGTLSTIGSFTAGLLGTYTMEGN